jgi:hypothetical protein
LDTPALSKNLLSGDSFTVLLKARALGVRQRDHLAHTVLVLVERHLQQAPRIEMAQLHGASLIRRGFVFLPLEAFSTIHYRVGLLNLEELIGSHHLAFNVAFVDADVCFELIVHDGARLIDRQKPATFRVFDSNDVTAVKLEVLHKRVEAASERDYAPPLTDLAKISFVGREEALGPATTVRWLRPVSLPYDEFQNGNWLRIFGKVKEHIVFLVKDEHLIKVNDRVAFLPVAIPRQDLEGHSANDRLIGKLNL